MLEKTVRHDYNINIPYTENNNVAKIYLFGFDLVWSSPVRHSCPPFVTDIEYYNRLSVVDSDRIHDVFQKKK